jgi:hypothetical protein
MMASTVVKYGIIGVGMMGREHLINLHHLRNEAVAVVAIADPHIPSQQLALQLAHSFSWPLKVSFFLLCFSAQKYSIFNCFVPLFEKPKLNCRIQSNFKLVYVWFYSDKN